MIAQTYLVQASPLGAVAARAIVLALILTALGIIAHVAM